MQLARLSRSAGDTRAFLEASHHSAAPRFMEFFTAQIRNLNTRRSYVKAAVEFLAWCDARGAHSLNAITPIHVAGWVEAMTATHSPPTVKQRLAAVRHLFDWLVTGHIMQTNPAHSVRGRSIRAGEARLRSCLLKKPGSCSTS